MSDMPVVEALKRTGWRKRIREINWGPVVYYLSLAIIVLACIGFIIISNYNHDHGEYTGVVVRRMIVRHGHIPYDPGERSCIPVAKPGGGVTISCRRRGGHPEQFWLVLEDGDEIRVSGFEDCPMGSYYAERQYCGPFYCWWERDCEGTE